MDNKTHESLTDEEERATRERRIAYEEWLAWQSVVRGFDDLGININDIVNLADNIKTWGERLHELRKHQETN